MTIHEEILTFMHRWMDRRSAAVSISPTALAMASLRYFETGELEQHIEYTSLEHLKQMARRLLANRFDDEGEDNPAYDQGELFSGALQERYPLPRKRGAEPQYKLRSAL